MSRPAFHPCEFYPELDVIQGHFAELRAEALAVRSSMTEIDDRRVEPGMWNVLPLLPEEEDRVVVPEDLVRQNRLLVPRTVQILSALPKVEGYALSALAPGGTIRPHRHRNPFVTAALCLQDGGDAYIVVGGEKRCYRDGEVIIFDYTLEHSVYNHGRRDRIALLVLLENRIR